LRVSSALYGWTTTSEPPLANTSSPPPPDAPAAAAAAGEEEEGKTEKAWRQALGYRSAIASSRNDPSPLPVPPAIAWVSWKPARESAKPASRSTMSSSASARASPWA
jgi:hypothetical protein